MTSVEKISRKIKGRTIYDNALFDNEKADYLEPNLIKQKVGHGDNMLATQC
jgi:hypothetical protein